MEKYVCLDYSTAPGSSVMKCFVHGRNKLTNWKTGKISKEEYDEWRYNYPDLDTSRHWHKVSPSKELSDYLVEAFKDRLKPDK